MPIPLKRPSWVQDFQAFIMRGNVVDLAVGIIIGAAFTGIVASLVKDLFNPLIGLLLGGIDFSNIFITLKGPHVATLEAAKAAGAVTLNVGVFINAVIQFLIVAFAVFWLVKGLSVLQRKQAEEPAAPPPPPRSETLLEEIRDLLAKH
ncbi:MAG: large conductance mechanosensitive channel protein MscL [Rhodospirillales bacterium]|nr:large conductance mechanosensitive channel protein MscL [Rhodospirillales bacterium]MDE2197885.1 large conductance mechanosensitive channel protein MscL [Rhodospirillales bacterium]MDE2575521.1 large conductance mechanosensitive channel protein MscL [Rhodospirillales bacterium]